MKFLRSVLTVGIVFILILSGCQSAAPVTTTTESELTPEESQETISPETDTISKIQGASQISPLVGQVVNNVPGIVTVLRSDGFYMQSVNPDGDTATSEGLFVLTETVPAVQVGDAVGVSGKVKETVPGGSGTDNLSTTQLAEVTVEVLSSGNDLPAATVVGEGGRIPPISAIDDDTLGMVDGTAEFDPDSDGLDFYESLEGMRIQINQALVVGPTNQYKEIVVVGDLGALAEVSTPRGGLVIQPEDFNPERIILDDLLVELPFVDVGDTSPEPIIGVVDYDYGNFKILPYNPVNFVSGGLSHEAPLDETMPGQLRVVDYNVENLSPKDPDRIATFAGQVVTLLNSPDIIGMQEIQDNNGSPDMDGVAADQTYQGIIDAILALGGPQYGYVNIDPKPGNDGGISGGNIRVGFLYRLDSGLTLAPGTAGDATTAVELIESGGSVGLSLNPGRIDPQNPAFLNSRKPLVVQFQYAGEPLFLINNHFNSKGGDMPLFGEIQPPVLETEEQRLQQAQVVHDFVAELLAMDPAAKVIVMGDLNDFQFSPPVELLAAGIMTDLIETLPINERYTYVYDGNGQVLDHILVSETLLGGLVGFDVFHLNSEFDIEQRFSDHDILVATFAIQ